jgi:molybdopterin synthase catalytic subunit
MISRVTRDPIDYATLVEEVRNHASGAVVLFLGTVRELSEGREVSGLTYEAYPEMAEAKLAEVIQQAYQKWSLQQVAAVHRYGSLALGDIAVAVVTASAHRAESFDAARWIMDTIKKVVPIWKKEHWIDAPPQWVHPSLAIRPDQRGESSDQGSPKSGDNR